MGMPVPVAEAIVAEHCHKRIEGEVLFVGRQTVSLDETSLRRLLAKYAITLPSDFKPGIARMNLSRMLRAGGRAV